MPNFDLIMFDLDGTLVETAPEIMDATNDTLRHFGLPEVTQQQVNDWIGHGTRSLLIQALAYVKNSTVEAITTGEGLTVNLQAFDKFYQARSLVTPNCAKQLSMPAGLGFLTDKVSPLTTLSSNGMSWCAFKTVSV